MTPPSRFIWPSWTLRDLWRWLMLLFGLLVITHGVFSKYVRMRGMAPGKVLKKPWQILAVRIWRVVIGIGIIIFGLSFDGR